MNNNQLVETVGRIVDVMDYVIADQLGLVPPSQYDVKKHDGRLYVIASFDTMSIGRSIKHYEHPDTVRVLRKALGDMPVVFTKKTWRYVVLASGKLSLPRLVEFPGFGQKDHFRLGICPRGEIAPHADRLLNVMIGAGQGAGKSNVLKLFAHQARMFGWKLYLADPDGHTFSQAWRNFSAAPIASSPEDLLKLIDTIYGELADRSILFQTVSVKGIPPENIEEYNKVAADPLPRIGLFVDEANTFTSNKKIISGWADILRRGRKWGLHVILSGHEWHMDVVKSDVNGMLQTRIGLTTANEENAFVALRDRRWAKWVLRKPAGRGVIRISQYQPMQFYKVTEEQEAAWLSTVDGVVSPISDQEALLVKRSLDEAEGKMTTDLLISWGMGQREARRLVETWEGRGWLERDPYKGNARVVTPVLAGFADKATKPTKPTNPHLWVQSPDKAAQTLNMDGDA